MRARWLPLIALCLLLCVLVLAIFFHAKAYAQTFRWVELYNPTKLQWDLVQGQDAATPAWFRIKCGVADGGPYPIVRDGIPYVVGQTRYVYPIANVITSPGTYWCVLSSYNQTEESPNSNQATWPQRLPPTAPQGFKVIITLPANPQPTP